MPTLKEVMKSGRFEFRISEEEEKQLLYIANSKHISQSEALRMGIKMMYKLEKARNEE